MSLKCDSYVIVYAYESLVSIYYKVRKVVGGGDKVHSPHLAEVCCLVKYTIMDVTKSLSNQDHGALSDTD